MFARTLLLLFLIPFFFYIFSYSFLFTFLFSYHLSYALIHSFLYTFFSLHLICLFMFDLPHYFSSFYSLHFFYLLLFLLINFSNHSVTALVDPRTAASISTSSIILLVLWCHRLCLQDKNIPQSEFLTASKNVPQNNDGNILNRSHLSDNKNDSNNDNYDIIPFYSQLKGCLLKIQNNFPSLQNLLNQNENENKNKSKSDFVIDSETVENEVEVEDNGEVNIKKILIIFSELWNLNTLGPGSALILLHCMRKRAEEGTRFCSNNDKQEIGDKENCDKYPNKNENEKKSISMSNKGKRENINMEEKRINRGEDRGEDIAAAVRALLDTVETIPTTRHPRLFFIISWLLTTPNAEYSSEHSTKHSSENSKEHSSAISEDPFLSPQFMSKNVRKDCSVMDLFVSNSSTQDGNNSDTCEYFNVNLPILPGVFEWLDTRVNDIFTVRSSDVLDSDALLSKGRALTSLIATVTHQLPFNSFYLLVIYLINLFEPIRLPLISLYSSCSGCHHR